MKIIGATLFCLLIAVQEWRLYGVRVELAAANKNAVDYLYAYDDMEAVASEYQNRLRSCDLIALPAVRHNQRRPI